MKRISRSSNKSDPSVADLVQNPPIAVLPPEWTPPEPDSPRGRILAAARRLFAEHGLNSTSVRDITAAANVNSAMVHYYFGNKDQLYERVLGFEFLAVFRTIHSQITPETPPGELLLSLPFRIMRVVRDNPVWAKLVSREMAMGGTHLQRVVEDLQDIGPLGVKRVFERLYAAAIKTGELKSKPSDHVIQFLIVLGYSGVFYEPFFRILSRDNPNSAPAFDARVKTFDELLRQGLISDQKKR